MLKLKMYFIPNSPELDCLLLHRVPIQNFFLYNSILAIGKCELLFSWRFIWNSLLEGYRPAIIH